MDSPEVLIRELQVDIRLLNERLNRIEAHLQITKTQSAYRMNTAAKMLDCSRDTVERLVNTGQLKSFKVGAARFISADELSRFIHASEETSDGG